MNNLSLGTTQGCNGVLNTLYKKLSGSIKVFLMLFLFTGSFSQSVFAQAACNAMTTPGFSSCAGEVITYTSNVNVAATGVWSIGPNTSGAFFVASGTSTVTVAVSPGPNTQQVNVGPPKHNTLV